MRLIWPTILLHVVVGTTIVPLHHWTEETIEEWVADTVIANGTCADDLARMSRNAWYNTSFATGTAMDYKSFTHFEHISNSVGCVRSQQPDHPMGVALLAGIVPHKYQLKNTSMVMTYCATRQGDKVDAVCLPTSCRASLPGSLEEDRTCSSSVHSPGWHRRWQSYIEQVMSMMIFMLPFIAWHRSSSNIYLESLSLKTSITSMFHVSTSIHRLTCVDGLRVLSMLWVIIGHTYMSAPAYMAHETFVTMSTDMQQATWAMVITNFTLSVDTFFVMSGTLTAFTWFNRPITAYTVSYWLRYYRHRVIRLWPVLGFVLMTTTYKWSILFVEPLWPWIDPSVQCAKAWWQTLFFVNTLYPNICMPWLWYIGNDMIYYLLSPFMLMALRYKVRTARIVLIGLIVASAGIRAYIMMVNSFPPTQFMWYQPAIFTGTPIDFHVTFYTKPYTRIGPYLVGILLGHYMSGHSKRPFIVRPVMIAVFGAMMAWSIFGLYPSAMGWSWPIYHTVYGSIHRTTFAMSIAALIYYCHYLKTNVINRLLSWNGFTPLAAISYSCYVFHMVVITAVYEMGVYPYPWLGHARQLIVSILAITLSFICGAVICVMVELPCIRLERVFTSKRVAVVDDTAQTTPLNNTIS